MEIFEIIVKFLSGNASDQDKKNLKDWLQEGKPNIETFKESETLWNALEIVNNKSKYDAEKAFSQFKNKINKNTTSLTGFKPKRLLFLILNVAAIIFTVTSVHLN